MLDKYFSLKKEISKNEELHNLNCIQASYNTGALFVAFSTFITLVFFGSFSSQNKRSYSISNLANMEIVELFTDYGTIFSF